MSTVGVCTIPASYSLLSCRKDLNDFDINHFHVVIYTAASVVLGCRDFLTLV